MIPTISIIMIAIKKVTIDDVNISNESNTNVQINIAPSVNNS
jgi:hypothetical protein